MSDFLRGREEFWVCSDQSLCRKSSVLIVSSIFHLINIKVTASYESIVKNTIYYVHLYKTHIHIVKTKWKSKLSDQCINRTSFDYLSRYFMKSQNHKQGILCTFQDLASLAHDAQCCYVWMVNSYVLDVYLIIYISLASM